MFSEDSWPVIAPLAVLAIVGLWKLTLNGIRWISKEVAENVVRAIGDTLSARWRADMEQALAPIKLELRDNGGNSLKDIVSDMKIRLGNVEQQLEAEILRDRLDDDIDGTPT